MRRETTSWFSHNLGMDMPLVAYGDAGYPLLMFPTAAADYLEYERFYLVDAIKDFIENGLIRAYSINSVNKYSLLNRESHPGWKVEMLARYDKYILDEVLPLIRNECGEDAKPLTTGASLGAFLAANTYFKHSDNFRGTIAMSGSYDIYNYLDKGYYDDNVYFNNPPDYLPGLDHPALHEMGIVFGTGDQDMCKDANVSMSEILNQKGINNWLDIRPGAIHDWPVWREMFPNYLSMINFEN